MRRSIAILALGCALTLVGCGVTTEKEPEDLTPTSPPAPTTPAVRLSPETVTSSTTPSPPVPVTTTAG